MTCSLETKRLWAVWLVSLALYGQITAPFPGSANDRVNSQTIQSLVHRGTLRVPGPDMDLARVGGYYYSVRPPVLAFLAAGPYVVFYALGQLLGGPDLALAIVLGSLSLSAGLTVCLFLPTTVWTPRQRWFWHIIILGLTAAGIFYSISQRFSHGYYPLITLASSGVLSATAVALICGQLRAAGWEWLSACGCAALVGFGSQLTVYATVFNHHSTTAGFLTVALCTLLAMDRFSGAGRMVLCGVSLGLAAAIDPAAGGIFLICLLPVALRRGRARFVLAGLAAVAALHCALNMSITGDPIPVIIRKQYLVYEGSFLKGSDLSGVWQYRSLRDTASYAVQLVATHKAILWFSPWIVPALLLPLRARTGRNRTEFRLIALATLLHLFYLILFTSNFAGNCYGNRWMVAEVPLWYLTVFLLFDQLRNWFERVCVIALAIYSVHMAWLGLACGAWNGTEQSEHGTWLQFGAVAVAAVLAISLIFQPARNRQVGRGW